MDDACVYLILLPPIPPPDGQCETKGTCEIGPTTGGTTGGTFFREDFVKHGSTLSGSCFLNIYKKLHISGNWFLNIHKKLQCLHSAHLKDEQKACDVIVRVET